MADEIDLDALAQQIADDAANPQQTTFDGLSVTNRSLKDQVDALKFLETRRAAKRFPLGRPIKFLNPGAVD